MSDTQPSSSSTTFTTNGKPPIMRFFAFEHLPAHLRPISEQCALLAQWMAANLPEGPETSAGLRKLLEAKDCFCRAKL